MSDSMHCFVHLSGSRLKRGYNNSGSGYRGDHERGYMNQDSNSSNEQDASVSRESSDHHQDSNSDEGYDFFSFSLL